MREFITRTREAVELAVVGCDVCGAKSTYQEEWHRQRGVGAEETVTTTVELDEMVVYPEAGERKVTRVDLCPPCFREKLLPFLEGLGAKPAVTETEW